MVKASGYGSWLPPRGSWIFWQSALRNRLSKKTDEGQRYLKVSDFSVEWYKPEHLCQLSNLIHQSTVRRPFSHFHRFRKAAESDSFPPGDAKGKKPCAFTIQRTAQSRRLAGGFYPPLRGVCKPAWRAIPSPGGRAVPYGYNPRSVIVRRFRRPYGWQQRSYGAAALPEKRFHSFCPPPPGTPGNHPGKIPA